MTGSTRGEVWTATLWHLKSHESFVAGEVEGVESSRMARRTWNEMEDLGLLKRDESGGQIWHRTRTAGVLVEARDAGGSEC